MREKTDDELAGGEFRQLQATVLDEATTPGMLEWGDGVLLLDGQRIAGLDRPGSRPAQPLLPRGHR